jgi:hypothetical protein
MPLPKPYRKFSQLLLEHLTLDDLDEVLVKLRLDCRLWQEIGRGLVVTDLPTCCFTRIMKDHDTDSYFEVSKVISKPWGSDGIYVTLHSLHSGL